MYDTIRLKSPYIKRSLFEKIHSFCVKRQGIDLRTGELIYQIVTGDLEGSYDSRISIQCRDYEFSSEGIRVSSFPYLIIEASAHKMLRGHNLFGGFNKVKDAIYFMITTVENILGLKLPCWFLWQVLRVDISQNYYIGKDNVEKWFYSNQLNDYQRRNVNRYENTGIYISGTTTTIKFYAKGYEFKKHDYKRIKALKGDIEANRLLNLAEDLLRCEVEIKLKKLKYDFKKDIVRVIDLSDDVLENIFNKEVERFMRAGENMYLVINEAVKVKERLFRKLSREKAANVFSTWTMLSTFGYKETKKNMAKSTFYKHVKLLKDLGITWYNSDISIIKSDVGIYDLTLDSNIAVDKLIKNKNVVNI